MTEIWKDIPDWEDYQVSNLGNVKSLKYGKERIMKTTYREGYQYVFLRNKRFKRDKKMAVHRLVAMAFLPNPNNLPQVNHKDECRHNNMVSNLEWCTAKYNVDYSQAKKVNQYDVNMTLIKQWDCVNDAGRTLNINPSNISQCCRGNIKYSVAGGFIWRYA